MPYQGGMNTELDESIARRYLPVILRRYRDAAGLSQQDLVNIVGVSKGFYSSLELGKRVPNLDMLVKIAGACNVKPGELLDAMVDVAKNDWKAPP